MQSLTSIQQLINAIPFEDGEADVLAMDEAVLAIDRLPEPRQAVPLLFNWFEAHAGLFVGSPGAFVHFIEEKLDFFPLLLASLARKPTGITVWMVNRIANAATNAPEIQPWIDVLQAAIAHPLADEECRDDAQHFLQRQLQRQKTL
jgi:hypothetical protein